MRACVKGVLCNGRRGGRDAAANKGRGGERERERERERVGFRWCCVLVRGEGRGRES